MRWTLTILAVLGCAKRSEPAPVGSAAPSAMYDEDARSYDRGLAKEDYAPAEMAASAPPPPPPPPPPKTESAPADGPAISETEVKAEQRMVHYAGYARLRVTRVQEALDAGRLVVLLARTESEQEKLALLHELQRVTEQLDAFERQRRMLKGLSDFSRISIDVVPREAVGGDAGGAVVAGFGWIESLSPFNRGVGGDEKRLALPVPDGMVAIDPKGQFVAESPEGAALWTGRVENDPRADAAFWIAAV
nr:DUF4349 domain-containing protein [Deltaproteobacteria bacterium]